MARTGRNDLCPCGSGRKFKKCCEAKGGAARQSRMLMIIIGAAIVAALVVGVASFRIDSTSGGGRVWDPAHGHYHDANGAEVP